MSARISHSLLDPWIGPRIKALYARWPLPGWLPPEAIIGVGHLLAIVGAVGFAWSTSAWWGGLLVALGVAGNHFADCIDGTHARATRQCRNGGELLDHFTDPLSFSYWIAGWAVSCGRLDLGLAGVICLYATAVLTNIKAKLVGRFTLATFGPTEFKTLLVAYGVALSVLTAIAGPAAWIVLVARFALLAMLGVGMVQLGVNLWYAVREVNSSGAPPDEKPWITRGGDPPAAAGDHP